MTLAVFVEKKRPKTAKPAPEDRLWNKGCDSSFVFVKGSAFWDVFLTNGVAETIK